MYEPIAIVGTACRLPGGANTPSKLWDLLKSPRDVLKEFTPERLGTAGFYHENGDMRGRSLVQHKSYLLEEDVRHFDNAFFTINPKEAADMDPQQRILLETVYEAFESAGWSLSDVDGTQTSVHVGVMTDDHNLIQSRDPDTLGGHAATGVSRSILANRLSYVFNLRGASLALDTACSSSLVALHMAVQGLQRGEATRAVVAGTNLLIDSSWYIMGSSMHMISPESRCRMWDKDASGYARGEGCGAVVLKTLSQAIRENDHIECIIRGTGVNSDGQGTSQGITMPSAAAQTALIHQTYRDAGLDPVLDRPQYFEAHGTGTQAGDPTEAQAIQEAFRDENNPRSTPLYCGSIKTIIGHLEGSAGIAGLIKASLAIQNKAIPPNMHFIQLNPKIEPFYNGLEVPTSLLPWPETGGKPRRASVNSFGFGGTNAHAILESYESSENTSSHALPEVEVANTNIPLFSVERRLTGPFVISAQSRGSLVDWLKKLLDHLRVNTSVDLDALSHTLQSKRSIFRYRVAIAPVFDQEDLIEKLEDQVNIISTSADGSLRSSPGTAAGEGVSILGIFTGQGAQAARMGFSLLKHCHVFKESIAECEKALASIPNPPSWSLSEELAADTEESHVSEARFSQPLCTAIQIALVDLLHACGIWFRAVVGHSSGEIGAAYAAGLLTRRDAMGISYYRGCVGHLARGESGQSGAMMAASMSFDAAADLCSEPRFEGRITVAASNSPSSVTLSGDRDAISEMKDYLDEKQVQARALQVDTAYHSHHMRACAGPYLQHLKELDVTIKIPPAERKCHWYSSVRRNIDILDDLSGSGLEGRYWVENLTQAVLFSEAVKHAVQENSMGFTAAIEVGPHGALRGPVNQTLKQTISPNSSLPYTSCLTRGKNAIEVFSEALTTIWSLAPSFVNFAGWRVSFGLPVTKQPLKDLPPYAWEHTQVHWRESRISRNYRLSTKPPHDILGRLWNDSGSEQKWRNTLRLSEMPWLRGHVFQNQILFPATGYISLAVDAAKVFAKGQSIKLVEVRDLTIPTALPIGEGDEIEILFTIRTRVSATNVANRMEAEFTCHAYLNSDLDEADKTCEGLLTIHLGEPEPTAMAPTYISEVELTPTNVDRFYHAASEIGFAYEGAFRALNSLNKVWGHAKATAAWSKEDPNMQVGSTLHPAIMDVAFQTGLSTILSLAEKSMHSPYLPIGVKRAVINPNQDFNTSIAIEAYMTYPTVGFGQRIETDINIKSTTSEGAICGIQLEGATFKAISEQQPSEDRNILAKTVWGPDATYGLVTAPENEDFVPADASSYTPEEYERVALFYLRRLSSCVSPQDMYDLQPHYQKLIRSIDAIVTGIREDGDRAFLKTEWLNDDLESITALLNRDPNDKNMALLVSSTDKALSLLKGGSTRDLRPGALYQQSTWGSTCRKAIAELMVRISHTFPRTNILHVCGGAAATVTDILDVIDDAYGAYTCASASQDFIKDLKSKIGLESAREKRLSFEVFEHDPKAGSEAYDVIIVTDLSYARHDLPENIRKMRSFLRPGGFLISIELTGPSLRPLAIMGHSEEWWANGSLGVEGPELNTGEWDNILSENGFFGIDSIFHDVPQAGMHGYSVFSAQAMDDRSEVLRTPLTSLNMITPAPIVLIGGETSRVSKLVRQGKNLLRNWAPEIKFWSRFDQIDCSQLTPECSVINLQDLDKPLFSTPPSVNELKNLKEVLGGARNLLWITSGRLVDDPYANIMVGIGRALRHEHIQLNLQFLDFDQGETWDVQTLMTQFLRLIFSTSSSSNTEGMLWVQEPEIIIRNAQMMTPRVLLDPESNEVYNASRRKVIKPVLATEPIEVVHETTGGSSEPVVVRSHPVDIPVNHLPLDVELSVALHVNEESPCYLSYGRLGDSGDAKSLALALSDTDSSVVSVPEGIHRLPQEYDATTLVTVASVLIAESLFFNMWNWPGTTLVCGASETLVNAISVLGKHYDGNIVFVEIAEEPQHGGNTGWVYLHPQSPARTVRRSLPHNVTALYDLSNGGASLLLSCLPQGCIVKTFDATSLNEASVLAAIEKYQEYKDVLGEHPKPTILSLSDLSQKPFGNFDRLSIVTDWNRANPVNAMIRALEPQKLVSPNKTYFLVGMASELGQSLSYFLVRSGARYIVLSSRNPKDNQKWLLDLRAIGIDIRVVKMDVTDRAQVLETVSMLRQTMPEIGGVTNAALVLEPAVFANLSAASIAKQMMPKIHGTVHLDEAFKNDPLEFFMCFGSLGTTFGNPGHAIYHAGNAFMMSLVENRKRRGLVGSILNFGMLVDVGYVARADRSAGSNVEEWLRTDGLIALSEADFHHVILQGITVGRPESPNCEVIMGVDTFHDRGQVPRPRWVGTPRLSHMVRRVAEASEGDAPSAGSHQSKLENASTVEEAIPSITELLSQKIKSMIHVSLDSIHPDEPLSRLGIDSINAIEIRKWLYERLKVEISMVKILGRDPSSSIIRSIATQYMAKKPEAANSTSKAETSVEAKAATPTKTDVSRDSVPATTEPNGKFEKITPEVPNVDQDQFPTLNHSQTSQDSGAPSVSSDSSPGWSVISTPAPERAPDFTRSEQLSIAQAGLFYIYKFSESHKALNITTRWRIDGPLDVERLSRAFQRTVDRHDALRTCFFANPGSSEVQQHVVSTKTFHLTHLQSSVGTADEDIQRVFDRLKEHRYAIDTGDTLQATLLRHNAQWHTLVFGFQNLIIDVVAISLILSDIAREYQSQPWSKVPSATSFLDYTREQMDDIHNERFDNCLQYWLKHLHPLPEVLPLLPVAKVPTRMSRRAYGHHYIVKELSSNSVQRITRLCQAHGLTPMQFYLSAMQVFLCRLLNIDDLVIGVLHTGRDPISKFRETIGHLASIMPIRFTDVLNSSFLEVMKNTGTLLLESLEHSDVPFAHIVHEVKPGVSEGNMPLIQVAYNYTVDEEPPTKLGDCKIAVEEADFTTVYDFVLDVKRSASGGHVIGVTSTDDFYSASATQFIVDTFFNVVERLTQDPLTMGKECKLFNDAQLEHAKTVARSPPIQNSWPGTLIERFAQVVAEFPDAVAIKEGEVAVTYSQLQQKVELYAKVLLEAKVSQGARTAVFCKPGIDLYTTILAIWRIGAILIPLDVSVPASRRNDIIKAGKPYALVCHAATAKEVSEHHMNPENKVKPLNITQLSKSARTDAVSLPDLPAQDPSAVTHILFTSGSTGVPKGINLHQRGIMNYAAVAQSRYNLHQPRVLQQTSIGFDVGFSQVYTAFTTGGTLIACPQETRGDPDMLSKLILDEMIQFTMCTPSEYSLLLAYATPTLKQCTEWRFAGAGGEALPQRVVQGLRALELPHLVLTNWYGPTEATVITSRDIPVHVGAASVNLNDDDSTGSNIGTVVPNNSVYIISEEDGSPLPVGVPGEICVAGVMVAPGYFDAEKDSGIFVKNPFATPWDFKAGFTTLYKTGDRGFLREDGSMIFLGRTKRGSTMIKLRGLRIDLNEVTGAILNAAPEYLADAAVTVRGEEEGQSQFLVCHVAFKPGRRLEHAQLMEMLQKLPLPRYMIPATVVALERMPLVPNGKLDLELLKTLPLPSSNQAKTLPASDATQNGAVDEKVTPTEQKLRALWISAIGPEIAGTADITPRTSFLAVGGNSYLLVHLQHAIEREMGVKVALSQLVQALDLRDMGLLVEKARVV